MIAEAKDSHSQERDILNEAAQLANKAKSTSWQDVTDREIMVLKLIKALAEHIKSGDDLRTLLYETLELEHDPRLLPAARMMGGMRLEQCLSYPSKLHEEQRLANYIRHTEAMWKNGV